MHVRVGKVNRDFGKKTFETFNLITHHLKTYQSAKKENIFKIEWRSSLFLENFVVTRNKFR